MFQHWKPYFCNLTPFIYKNPHFTLRLFGIMNGRTETRGALAYKKMPDDKHQAFLLRNRNVGINERARRYSSPSSWLCNSKLADIAFSRVDLAESLRKASTRFK